jgi:hypothetical protein
MKQEILLATDNDPDPISKAGSGHFKRAMLQQMAEALEDQVAALCRRVVAFEEEDFLLTREIEEHMSEINRLHLKLDGVRDQRDHMLERVECLRAEASSMREAVFGSEKEGTDLLGVKVMLSDQAADDDRRPMFFQRMTLP